MLLTCEGQNQKNSVILMASSRLKYFANMSLFLVKKKYA